MNTSDRVQLVHQQIIALKKLRSFAFRGNYTESLLIFVLAVYLGMDSIKQLHEVTASKNVNVSALATNYKKYVYMSGRKYKLTPAGIELCEKYIATLQPE